VEPVTDWRQEVEAELDSALRRLTALAPEVKGNLTAEQAREVWGCYLLVEKGVAFIKLELDDGGAGRFVEKKSYSVPDDRQAISLAATALRAGAAEFAAGRMPSGLRSIRDARNHLRMLLRRTRLSSRRPAARTSV